MEFSILNSKEKKFLLNALFCSTLNVSVICYMNKVGEKDTFCQEKMTYEYKTMISLILRN